MGPVDDFSNNSLGGYKGEQIINRSIVSSLGMSMNPVTMVAFRELWWILLIIRAPLQPPKLLFCERILNRTHHNSSDSLMASVVAGLADI